MTKRVTVVDNEYCGYYDGTLDGNSCSGSTSTVTLKRGNEYVRCEDILIWEECNKEIAFEEWKELALDGEEGVEYWRE